MNTHTHVPTLTSITVATLPGTAINTIHRYIYLPLERQLNTACNDQCEPQSPASLLSSDTDRPCMLYIHMYIL